MKTQAAGGLGYTDGSAPGSDPCPVNCCDQGPTAFASGHWHAKCLRCSLCDSLIGPQDFCVDMHSKPTHPSCLQSVLEIAQDEPLPTVSIRHDSPVSPWDFLVLRLFPSIELAALLVRVTLAAVSRLEGLTPSFAILAVLILALYPTMLVISYIYMWLSHRSSTTGLSECIFAHLASDGPGLADMSLTASSQNDPSQRISQELSRGTLAGGAAAVQLSVKFSCFKCDCLVMGFWLWSISGLIGGIAAVDVSPDGDHCKVPAALVVVLSMTIAIVVVILRPYVAQVQNLLTVVLLMLMAIQ
eukprot:gene10944-294_t